MCLDHHVVPSAKELKIQFCRTSTKGIYNMRACTYLKIIVGAGGSKGEISLAEDTLIGARFTVLLCKDSSRGGSWRPLTTRCLQGGDMGG